MRATNEIEAESGSPAPLDATGEGASQRFGAASGGRVWPLGAMGVAALALTCVLVVGRHHPIPFGFFSHPPIYGVWHPTFDDLGILAATGGIALAAIAWFVTRARHVPTWLTLVVLVGAGIALGMAVALVRGDWTHLSRGVSTAAQSTGYASDLHYVYEFGVRGFAERHPELTHVFHSWNSRTHPPGGLVLLSVLFRVFGNAHAVWITSAIALLGMCSAVSAWSMGRTLGGERSGRISAVLLVAAPGPLLLAYTSMDAVYATLLSGSAALFLFAVHRSSPRWAVLAGAALGVTAYFTYAVSFVALAAGLAILVEPPRVRAFRLIGAAAAGGLAALLMERVVLGFDLLGSYGSVPGASRAYDPYWVFGAPTAVLIFAGLPLAGIGVAGLFARQADGRRAVLPLALVAIMLIWFALPSDITHLRPGEVERTWAFVYPVLAACAGPVVDRWTRRKGKWSGAVVAALVVVSVAQAVVIQALWDTLS